MLEMLRQEENRLGLSAPPQFENLVLRSQSLKKSLPTAIQVKGHLDGVASTNRSRRFTDRG